MKWITDLEQPDPENLKERLSQCLYLLMFGITIVIVFAMIACYFCFLLFILDWIYWVISGKTVLWKKLMD